MIIMIICVVVRKVPTRKNDERKREGEGEKEKA